MSFQLIGRVPYTLMRSSGEGYYDDNNNYVPASKIPVDIDVFGISPYRDGYNSFRIPTGFNSLDAIVVRSTTEFIAHDETSTTVADELTYKGKVYICYDKGGWEHHADMGFQLIPNHYEALFYRKDKI